jgi:ribosomal protein S18 acetylase RimI-like enzyme
MARRLISADEQPTAAATAAAWLVAEWTHLYPEWDLETATNELLAGGPEGQPPLTWLLFDDESTNDSVSDSVIGSVGLALDGELEPARSIADTAPSGTWVVNLFVTPAAGGRGQGSTLLYLAVEFARSLDIDELLLTTEHSVAHYRSKGWTEVGSTLLNGHESVVMSLSVMAR